MAKSSDLGIMNTLRHHYGIVRGFILPVMLIIGPCMLIVAIVSRNFESCKKAKARGEKCPSIWWTSAGKDKAIKEDVKQPAPQLTSPRKTKPVRIAVPG